MSDKSYTLVNVFLKSLVGLKLNLYICALLIILSGLPWWLRLMYLPAMQETTIRSLDLDDTLE